MALTVDEILRRNAKIVPDRVAATMDGEILTYRDLDLLSDRTAVALAEAGIAFQDRVVTWSDNHLGLVPLFFGLAKLGAVFAPLNPRLNPDEAVKLLSLADPRLLVVDAAHWEQGSALAKAAGIACLCLDAEPASHSLAGRAGAAEWRPVREPKLEETSLQVLFFTSGSTGAPKGVMLSHRANFLRSFQGEFTERPPRMICMFPLFHMSAFTLGLLAWQSLGEITFVKAPAAPALLDAVVRRRANHLYCIPSVWARVLAEDTGRWDLSSLHWIDTGTSATPPELIRALKERFPHALVRVFYGSTEAGYVTGLFDDEVLAKAGAVGRPGTGVELRISEAGEIVTRTHYLMDGYFRNEPATRSALIDGWYHSGDKGALDADGHLHVTGRLKDIIRSGGETVAPTEVEDALRDHPAVAEVAVVGIPDPQWGEVVCAVVVARGTPPALEELRRHAEARLASYKMPRRLELMTSIPRTAATAQIQRALIIEQIQSKMG